MSFTNLPPQLPSSPEPKLPSSSDSDSLFTSGLPSSDDSQYADEEPWFGKNGEGARKAHERDADNEAETEDDDDNKNVAEKSFQQNVTTHLMSKREKRRTG